MVRSVHLVGSCGLHDEEEVFRTLGAILGERAPRYPDGETGARHYWIRWQQQVFENHPQLRRDETAGAYRPDAPLPFYRPREGVDPADVTFGPLGYADAAIHSYATFERLKAEGAVPETVRFMVALPTPVAVVTSFISPDQRTNLEPAYERAMLQEVARIVEAIPPDRLSIQWDVCHEVLAEDGAFPLQYDDVLENSLVRLARLGASVPGEAELGFHLCYGDPGHKHIQEPKDTATAVAFANGLAERVPRRVDWIHMPVPRERSDDAYFAPLQKLKLKPETRLILGLVHYTDGVEGTLGRVRAAEKVVRDFGIATECGFGRRPPETIPDLLKIHVAIADGA